MSKIQNNPVPNFFLASAADFKKIPGSPIAYWVSERVKQIFEKNPLIEKIAYPKQGSTIGNNEQFLRMWYEISSPYTEKWKRCIKGGDFRRWYGNLLYLVNWGVEKKAISGI